MTSDINEEKSKKSGFFGLFENIFRKFSTLGFLLCLSPIIILYILAISFSILPTILIYQTFKTHFINSSIIEFSLFISLTIGVGFILFILCLITIVPIFNFPFRFFVKPSRGAWFSVESLPWLYHNALTYLVRYTVLDFITPSPLNIYFFKMMGMKIGKGVMINSSNISDPCMIEIKDYSIVGGSAYLMAHYGMKGYLIKEPLVIHKGASIGLSAKILGGVTIGEKSTILPNSTVLPKTIVPDGAKYPQP